MSTLTMKEKNGKREVCLHDRAFYHGGWHENGVTFISDYSRETLEAIYYAKGAYLYDEILRLEDKGYLEKQFLDFVKRQVHLPGKHVLDFGNGCASSSILLARAGAMVTGVEIIPAYRKAADLRVRDERLQDRIAIVETDDMQELPFDEESFDVITLSAVIEHMKPEDRMSILYHLWSLLRPGGLLIITETPNRLWPYDSHTTRLPFVSWLPLPFACLMARVFRPVEFAGKSREDLVYDGIVGSTWWTLKLSLPKDAKVFPMSPRVEYEAYFKRLRSRKRGLSWLLVEVLALVFFPLAFILSMTTRRLPINAFFPYLNVAFEKET